MSLQHRRTRHEFTITQYQQVSRETHQITKASKMTQIVRQNQLHRCARALSSRRQSHARCMAHYKPRELFTQELAHLLSPRRKLFQIGNVRALAEDNEVPSISKLKRILQVRETPRLIPQIWKAGLRLPALLSVREPPPSFASPPAQIHPCSLSRSSTKCVWTRRAPQLRNSDAPWPGSGAHSEGDTGDEPRAQDDHHGHRERRVDREDRGFVPAGTKTPTLTSSQIWAQVWGKLYKF